ncbi:MAG: hypothetical protein QOF63_2789, partial [Thermoanaerobaculia bacterium]|nr:hypothetical protein [Thermoanaerobaculia bacterium]
MWRAIHARGERMAQEKKAEAKAEATAFSAPTITLPKGGGAIRGIGEKFAATPVTGTGSLSIPLPASPGRAGFSPHLALSYDSGAGNGPFGIGWSLSLPSITRKTDKGLPQYRDAEESDVFIISGSEDLVPVLQPDGCLFEDNDSAPGYTIRRYRPRIEGLFARIERWTALTGDVHWRSITRDNVTTLYGKTSESRIADPCDPRHVFTWLICESYDDKGNAVVYRYAAENDENVARLQANERHRVRGANRYLKRIDYGNRVSRLVQPDRDAAEWLFRLVFDYGDEPFQLLPPDRSLPHASQHSFIRVTPSPDLPWDAPRRSWAVRPDPFSQYRAGFEVRTYRRCQRVLMYHAFDELGGAPYLVRCTEFDFNDLDYGQPAAIDAELAYEGSTRFASFIGTVTHSGFARDGARGDATYLRKSMPPLDLHYSKAVIQDEVGELDPGSARNLPIGVDGATYRFVDLNGEGAAGVLTEEGGAWFYKPSLGDGRFGPVEMLPTKPSPGNLAGGRQELLDLAGDGHLDIVAFSGPAPGFFERTEDDDWKPFRPFEALPHVRWDDPNLRFVDLNGDGHADVLIAEDEVFTWYPSLAEEGFEPARRVYQPLDDESGPRLVFSDGTQSIYLADMSGDGLTDIARIRNGEVCYWPNIGYGRFGAKVTMDDAPWFDNPDQFSEQRIRLADINGSGVSDIIYIARNGVRLYFNQSGNRWSAPRRLRRFPAIDNISSVAVADLFGNGTACLVWSSPLPAYAGRPLRYIDLMGGQKPNLLIRSINNLGAETHVHYAPSTKFYFADKAAGAPWITKLPFPVHVVEKVETLDRVSGNRFVTRYAFHHGYFDGVEREFRGFGMVEQWDTEDLGPSATIDPLYVPPVQTKTWFHTGVYLAREEHYKAEFFREPGLTETETRARVLDDTVLPRELTFDEEREAYRALKGSMLRREIYAIDGTAKERYPYSVTEQNFTIRVLQRLGDNRHAVFFTHPRESIDHHYEREPADARTRHALTLAVDDYGNVVRSADVAYARRGSDPALSREEQTHQSQTLITLNENRLTNSVSEISDYRAPLPAETRKYELTGFVMPASRIRFTWDEIAAAADAAKIGYEESPGPYVIQKRLIEDVRTLFRHNDLTGALRLGEVQSRALPFESYKLALTPNLVANIYGGRLTDTTLSTEGGYVHFEGDANWWIPSGRVFYSPDSQDAPAAELAHAREHFFLPARYRDPFHTEEFNTETVVRYDNYDLLARETRDPLGNVVTVNTTDDAGVTAIRIDYRVLRPYWLTDPNGNRTAVTFDALGMVAGTAVMGKPVPAPPEGDTLEGFTADLTDAA